METVCMLNDSQSSDVLCMSVIKFKNINCASRSYYHAVAENLQLWHLHVHVYRFRTATAEFDVCYAARYSNINITSKHNNYLDVLLT